jgi:hypothetical protein
MRLNAPASGVIAGARRRLVRGIVLAACATGGVASWVRAEEQRTASLTYQVAANVDTCEGQAELESQVASRVGYVPFAPNAPLAFDVRVERSGASLVGRVVVKQGGRELKRRELVSANADCRELMDAVGVALAITIDPLSLTRPPAAPGAPSAASAPTASAPPISAASTTATAPPVPTPRVSPAPPPAERPPNVAAWQLRAHLAALGALGLTPGGTVGAELGVGFQHRIWSAEFLLRADAPREKPPGASPDVAALRARFSALGVLPCVHHAPFSGCAALLVGRVSGEGLHVTQPRTDSTSLVAGGLRGGVELPASNRVTFLGFAEALSVLTPVALTVNEHTVWETRTFAGTLGLGVRGRLP